MDFRDESSGDHKAIRHLLLASFPGPGEADLVERLRGDGDAVTSLVAIEGRVLTGHVMFSKMAAPFRALGLGPVSVLPDWRRRGIAATLIQQGIKRATKDGWAGVFVLGDPDYYQRFGFKCEHAESFESPYSGPYLMALPLNDDRLPIRFGRLDYAPAFSALG
ncbi:GNAT family N-acetyltransferase [Bradyrhizobium sp. URHD0069]|uniref:GNAT family N-acetyltransferase n=1 Tax=Bradyrhizobium sp. URHD0069 TaxID=1380355 RepID=UPI0004969ED5|nr:N-acetyltransferase [Bradyrhizobium sp. URHD0069]